MGLVTDTQGEPEVRGMRQQASPIPISAAKRIADECWYDQVVIMARRVGEPGAEHITTYGITKTHCDVAAMMGRKLKEIAGWPDDDLHTRLHDVLQANLGRPLPHVVTALVAELKR